MSVETYFVLKQLHRLCAALSIAGFIARWLAVQRGRPWVRQRLARTMPHVVDTLLLGSALALAFGAGFTPGNSPWLLAKIVLLLAYIALGMIALSARVAAPVRWWAGSAAIAVFAQIVATAVLKQPAGLLRALS